MQLLQTTTLAGQTIVNPLLIATYTAAADYELIVNVHLSGVIGGSTYRACMTRQRLGAGAFYQSPTSAAALAAGITTLWLPSLSLAVQSGDVVRVYAQGIAGDIAVGTIAEVWDVTPIASASFLSAILEGAHTVGDAFRIMLAALAGRSTGGGTFTNRYRDVANVKNRIDATVNAAGDRVGISIDGT